MHFEIVSVDGGFKARILDNEDEVVFVSQKTYETKLSAEAAIAMVVHGAAGASTEERR